MEQDILARLDQAIETRQRELVTYQQEDNYTGAFMMRILLEELEFVKSGVRALPAQLTNTNQ